jgi:metallo-beta-lactamase family protein
MCEAGRILHHLANNISDPNNTILITGFQAQNTLGRRLVEGVKEVRIFGQLYPVRAEVVVLNEFSAHADSQELQTYAEHVKGLERIFLVHGEENQAQALAEQLHAAHPQWQVTVPERDQSFEF